MLKQRSLFLTFLVIVAMVLAACGGAAVPAAPPPAATEAPAATPAEEAEAEETEAEATEVATEEAEEEATEAEAEATEAPAEETPAAEASADEGPALTIWADDTRASVLSELGAAFEAEYGLRVVVTEKAFGDIRDDLKVAGPAGEGPDIIIGAHDWLGELAENGLLAEIDLADKADLFLPTAVQAFVYDGVLYGMPYATENVAFIYNPELVETAPATWTEVKEVSQEIVDSGAAAQGFIIQENDPYHFFPIETAFGGYVFGLTEEGYDAEDVGIDNEGSIAAAEWLDSMYKDGLLVPGSAVNYDLMHAAFTNGDAAMMITGPWALPMIRESGVPYAVANLPSEVQEAQPFVGVQGFMISSFSDDVLLAQTFLQEFVATEETMQAIFDADPRPSAFIPVRDAISDEDIAAFAEAGANGLPMPAIPEMSAVWTSWGNAMQLVSQQAEAAEAAFTTAAEQIRAAIAGE
jgi:maltose/maltodextrin transport system substrate-binding protein/arabinogalactan oligomer/maltooligosaccharide transport system substrate-binding protein